MRASDVKRPELWQYQRLINHTVDVGVTLRYDTRDSYTEPHTGWCLTLTLRFSPRFLGNDRGFASTQFTGSRYCPVWKGGVIAMAVSATAGYGDVPWYKLASFGGSSRMRGYYEGRYRDKTEVDAVVELRQHLWRRNGIVVWAGAATVAPNPGDIRLSHALPCFGAGYRWEFKSRCNVRLDFGVGRGETSFIFNINEAF